MVRRAGDKAYDAAPVMTATRPSWMTGCTSSSMGATGSYELGRRGDGLRLDLAEASVMV